MHAPTTNLSHLRRIDGCWDRRPIRPSQMLSIPYVGQWVQHITVRSIEYGTDSLFFICFFLISEQAALNMVISPRCAGLF
jgi:hypothetical protein